MDVQPDDAVRAHVYRLLAALLVRPPGRDVLDLLRDIPPLQAGATEEMAAAWETLRLASERTEPRALEDEYHDLFIGIAHGEVIPYGSWYMTGSLMDRPLVYLRRDLAELGFERQEEVKEPEDHTAALLETMSLIIESGERIPFERQSRFFSEHIAPWMEMFFRDLQSAEAARFYRAVGQFGERFLAFERQYLAMAA